MNEWAEREFGAGSFKITHTRDERYVAVLREIQIL